MTKMFQYAILTPDEGEKRVAMNLVKDAGGCILIEGETPIVKCKKSIAKALDLVPCLNVEEKVLYA